MNFSAKRPNEIWVSDIIQFRIKDKTYYLCAVLDLFSRKVIAYKIAAKQSTQLTSATLKMAYIDREPNKELIVHTDQGGQYTSDRFQQLLKSLDISQSFSPKGRPTHNSVIETFYSSLRQEETHRYEYHSENEFKQRIENTSLL